MDRLKFNNFAGLKVNGTVPLEKKVSTHFDRASWLTAQVESGGKFGTVINYDGTGITAGIHQAIAVYPRTLDDNNIENDQGPLWRLLFELENTWNKFSEDPTTIDTTQVPYPEFKSYLEGFGLSIKRDKALSTKDGRLLGGKELRFILSGSEDGILPEKGLSRDRAEAIVSKFHKLFSSRWTFDTQLEFGKEHFSSESQKVLRFCESFPKVSIKSFLSATKDGVSFEGSNKLDEKDLAFCVYWSNSVNAPGYSLKVLCKVLDIVDKSKGSFWEVFPKRLIKSLGSTSFGRWDDDIPGGRYQRTRSYAMKVWPIEFFEGSLAIMPKNLED